MAIFFSLSARAFEHMRKALNSLAFAQAANKFAGFHRQGAPLFRLPRAGAGTTCRKPRR
jgi:hypothetical protein